MTVIDSEAVYSITLDRFAIILGPRSREEEKEGTLTIPRRRQFPIFHRRVHESGRSFDRRTLPHSIFIVARRYLTRRTGYINVRFRQKIPRVAALFIVTYVTIQNEKVRRRYSNTSQLKVRSPEDKLVRLNVNKVPSRKRRKSYELRLDGVPDTYARTVSVINDYNVRRGPFVFLSRVCKKGLSPS